MFKLQGAYLVERKREDMANVPGPDTHYQCTVCDAVVAEEENHDTCGDWIDDGIRFPYHPK